MTNPVLGSGTSQQDRDLPALTQGYFNVDEMKFENLLAAAAEYSKLLKFYNSNNQADGDWQPFFIFDEAVIMAQILTTDLVKVESEFFIWLARSGDFFRPGQNPSETDLRGIPNFELAMRLDSWLNQLQFNQFRAPETGESKRLSDSILSAIEAKLRSELHSLTSFLGQFFSDVDKAFMEELSDVWHDTDQSGGIADIPQPSENDQQVDRYSRFMTLNFYSFYHAISSLKSVSLGALPDSLENGAHDPTTAMYIAFVKLYEKVQSNNNLFTERHLDFYFKDILKAQPKELVPDSTFLILRPDVEEKRVLIKRGREFLGGVDENNQDVIYTADNDVLIHGARVIELRTLHLDRDERKSPEYELGFTTASRSNQITVVPEDVSAGSRESPARPLFGAPKEHVDEDLSEHAEIGFALASPVLFLGQGNRNLTIEFRVEYLKPAPFRPFRLADLKKSGRLANRLRKGRDAVSTHLRKQFSPSTDELLKEFDKSNASVELQNALVTELNAILTGEPLYEIEEIKQGPLRGKSQNRSGNENKGPPEDENRERLADEIRTLVANDPQGDAVSRINRLILEMEYRDELKKLQYVDYVLDELCKCLKSKSVEEAFFKLFGKMFSISLTAETGWYEVPEYSPESHVVVEGLDEDIIRVQIQLPPEVAPIVSYSSQVHGGQFETELPVMKLLINPTSYLYPYDLLRISAIKEIKLSVDVEGVKNVLLYNDLGQLDPTGPFNPFGALPSVGSYLIVGSSEIAVKNVTEFDVNVGWSGLPTETGGFEKYYQAYEESFSESSYEATITVLSDGNWLPYEEQLQEKVKLFGSADDHSRTGVGFGAREVRLPVGEDATRILKALNNMTDYENFAYSSGASNGFIKFTLSSPEYAFGHKEYPRQLTGVLTANSRLKHPRLFKPIPNPPYTPLVNAVSVDYRAVSVISSDGTQSPGQSPFGEKVFHIHPFGSEQVSTDRSRKLFLVPEYDSSGNLFIGLSASELSGSITLFFHLSEDCSPGAGEKPTSSAWSYLSANMWHQLAPDQVISDSTDGFLSSGVVTLNIPEGIDTGNSIMPGNLFWLKVSVKDHPEYLASVYSVHAQGLKVTHQYQGNHNPSPQTRLPARTIKEPRVNIPGIDLIHQIVDSVGGSPPESAARVKTRLSERLRHKNRAVTPWDYERLILERFPGIQIVKCFKNLDSESVVTQRPGHIMIVVVPNSKEHSSATVNPIVNGLFRREISEYVKSVSSPFANIRVRSASYERIQVRCTVRFAEEVEAGYGVRTLNQAITDYLSPWNTSIGYAARFDWSVRCHEIESFIFQLPYVEFVTKVSLLHIATGLHIPTGEDDYHYLIDTARKSTGPGEVRSKFPWSIAVPMRDHFIELTDETRTIRPEKTGIKELRIGSTLIITDRRDNE